MAPIAFNSPWLILCEGEGDEAFFRHLIDERRLPAFEIQRPKPLGGKTSFGQRLSGLKTHPDFKRLQGILIVSDNDDDPKAAFQNIRDQVAWAGFGVPDKPLEAARAPDLPAIVIAMLPWSDQSGDLESVCLIAASEMRPDIAACLDAYCGCTKASMWKPSKLSKMRMRCFLSAACEVDPNTSLVYAWSGEGRGVLIPLAHSCFDGIAGVLANFPKFLE